MRRLVGTSDYLKIDLYEKGKKKPVNSATLYPYEFIVQLNLAELNALYKALEKGLLENEQEES